MTTAKFISAASINPGTTWASFPSVEDITVLHVLNNTATDIDFRRSGDASAVFRLPTNLAWSFKGLTDASQLQFRRGDVSNTIVNIFAEAELEHQQ